MNHILSDKPGVRNLVEICAAKGIRYVIISPGSRNAPLNISFNEHGAFTCLSIPDERCAAFVAMGIAQQTGIPAIVTCTSGSAALNFAPAISEAFYQKIPMIVLTADRPDEWINQGEGQSINQRNIYHNYILKDYHLHLDTQDQDNNWSNNRMICEAIDISASQQGPVHINMPFREPLYGKRDYTNVSLPKIHQLQKTEFSLDSFTMEKCSQQFNSTAKVMILCGLIPRKNTELQQYIESLSSKAVVLSETTSNIQGKGIHHHIDALLTQYDKEAFKPDLLITIGHSFISKKIKLWLREFGPDDHWHISEDEQAQDVFQALTKHLRLSPNDFFRQLSLADNPDKTYPQLWKNHAVRVSRKHHQFMDSCPWSDFKAFSIILPHLPQYTNLHMGNSSPVRYIQLFPVREDILYNGNRGVSGIDGSTSTAMGAAYLSGQPTTLISGDIAFFYDSNAFWNHHLTGNLRIIVINNQGGGIFRLIAGPPSTGQLEEFFETKHDFKAKGICDTFHIPYYFAENSEELEAILPQFYAPQNNDRPAVLEIFTPREINDSVFRDYYHNLK